MSDKPISDAYYHAIVALGNAIGSPLPKGLNTARIGDWILTVNISSEPLEWERVELLPYQVAGRHEGCFAFVMIGSSGGVIGGMTEDQFISDMKAEAA